MRQDIERIFNEFITTTFAVKPVIRDFIMNHERKNLCIENLAREIFKIEGSNAHLLLSAERFRQIIRDYARAFSRTALDHLEEKALSHAEKQRRISAADEIKRTEEFVVDLEKEALDKKLQSFPGRPIYS